jgi:hypothetical protein
MLSMSLDPVVSLLLWGHLYRIPEVVPTTAPPKQCYKVVSHTTKFIFSTICSKWEQKDTATTTASTQAPSIHQKQVDKVAAKHKDSFCTQSSKISRLIKKVQTFQLKVHDRLQQAKQPLLQQGKQITKIQIQQSISPLPRELHTMETIAS